MHNKVKIEALIVGSDHQNTLGVIRAIGKMGIIPHVIIHSQKEYTEIKCFKSRYALGDRILVESNAKLLISTVLFFAKSHEQNNRIPIIPTDDFSEYIIDQNLCEIEKYYITPSINGKPGEIARLMDKYEQFKEMRNQKILKANTWIVNFDNIIYNEWKYPVILKPKVSALGSKCDIIVVEEVSQLSCAFKKMKKLHYDNVLVQEYVEKEYEMCTFGCITKNTQSVVCGTLKKLRYYPYSGGSSLSYAKFCKTPKEIFGVLEWLKSIGYSGLFDIESFSVKGRILLNEINFRNSGNTWSLVKEGINVPLIWIYDAMGIESTHDIEQKRESYFMNETSDLHHVIDKKISLVSWIKDLVKTSSFNKFWIKDIRGSIVWYKRK